MQLTLAKRTHFRNFGFPSYQVNVDSIPSFATEKGRYIYFIHKDEKLATVTVCRLLLVAITCTITKHVLEHKQFSQLPVHKGLGSKDKFTLTELSNSRVIPPLQLAFVGYRKRQDAGKYTTFAFPARTKKFATMVLESVTYGPRLNC
jgi:hypothetical protein